MPLLIFNKHSKRRQSGRPSTCYNSIIRAAAKSRVYEAIDELHGAESALCVRSIVDPVYALCTHTV